MKCQRNLTIVACLFALAVTGSALARGLQDDVNLCQTAFKAESDRRYDGAKFKFKSERGSKLRTLTFKMTFADQRYTVDCKVKRGEVVEIVWPEILTN